MRLLATGWNRNMGANPIGNPDVESAIPYGPSKDVTAIKKRRDEIQISWCSKYITLTGTYRMALYLSKDDIIILFKEFFGEHLSVADLESNGLHLSNEGLKEKLCGMTIGEFSELVSIGAASNQHQDSPSRAEPETSEATARDQAR